MAARQRDARLSSLSSDAISPCARLACRPLPARSGPLTGNGGRRLRFETGVRRLARVARRCVLGGRSYRLPPRSGTRTYGTRRRAPQRLRGRRARPPDRDVSFGSLLEPPHAVWIELALDPRPGAGYRLKRAGVHDLLSCPPDLSKVSGQPGSASVLAVSQNTMVSYMRRPYR